MRRLFLTLSLAAGMVATQLVPVEAAPVFNLTLAATPTVYTGPCPAVIKLDGKIVNAPTYVPTAHYSLLNSDGIDSFDMTATFDAAHTFAVHDGRTPSASGTYWVKLLVHDGAGGQVIAQSRPAVFRVVCTGKATPNPNATPTPRPTPTPCISNAAAGMAGCPTPNPNDTPQATPRPTATPCLQTTAAGVPCPTKPPQATPRPTPKATPTPCSPNTPAGVPCVTPRPTPKATPTPPCPTNGIAGVPCPTSNPNATPRPCVNPLTNALRCPDLTARPPAKVGGVPTTWGAGVTLTAANRIPGNSPMCAFDIYYTMVNIGSANAGPPGNFRNVLRVDGSTVSIQSLLTLATGASQTIHTQAYLPAGVHALTLDLNDPHTIGESNYANNHFAMKYQLTGRCAAHR